MRKFFSIVLLLLACVTAKAQTPVLNKTPGWYKIPDSAMAGGPENNNFSVPDTFPNNLGFTSFGFPFATRFGSGFRDSSTAFLDTTRNRVVFWQGGHSGYWGNDLFGLEINCIGSSAPATCPVMVRYTNPANPNNIIGNVNTVEVLAACTFTPGCTPTTNSPGSRHTYNNLAYIPPIDKMLSFGGGTAPQGNSSSATWLLNMNSFQVSCSPTNLTTQASTSATGCDPVWTQLSPSVNPLGNQYNYVNWDVNHPTKVWIGDDNDTTIRVFDTTTNNWSTSRGTFTVGNHSYSTMDPIHQYFITVGGGDGVHYFSTANPAATGIVVQTPTLTNCSGIQAGGSGQLGDNGQYPGTMWDPIDRMVRLYMNGGPATGGQPLYLLDPATWNCYTETFGTTQTVDYPQNTPNSNTGDQGTFGHFQYIPAYDIFTLTNDPNRDSWYFSPRRPGVDITNVSASTLTNQPYTHFAQFRQGDVPQFADAWCTNSAGVFTHIATTQTDVRNRWPDGSLKTAAVSFVIPSIAPGQKMLCRYGSQASGNNTGFLTPAQMLAAGFNFDGQIQLTGTASHNISARTMLTAAGSTCGDATGSDPDGVIGAGGTGNPCWYWMKGPVVTAVILEDRSAQAFDVNTDGQTGNPLHPIFEAWFYPQTNQVQLGYTLENDWASTTTAQSARDQTYSYTLTAGNTGPANVYFSGGGVSPVSETVLTRSRWHHMFCTNGTGLGTQNGCLVGVLNTDHRWAYLASTKLFLNWDPNTLVMATGAAPTHPYPNPQNFLTAWNNANTNKSDVANGNGTSGLGVGFFPGFHTSCGDSNSSTTGDQCSSGGSNRGFGSEGAAYYHGPLQTADIVTLITQDPNMLNVVTPGEADAAAVIPYWFRERDVQPNSHFFDSPNNTVQTRGRFVSINARTQVDFDQNNATSCSTNFPAEFINYGGTGSPVGDTGILGQGGLDDSHWPETSYVAYMMSGQFNYYEQELMQGGNAVGNSISLGPCVAAGSASHRQGAIGYAIYNNDQDRAVVWALRQMALGATVAVDGSPEQAYLLDKLRTNLASIEGSNNIPCSFNGIGTPVQVNYCSGTRNGNVAAWTWGNTVRNSYPYIGGVFGTLFEGTTAYSASNGPCLPTDTGCTPSYSSDSNFMNAYTSVMMGMIDQLGFCPHTNGACPLVQWESNYFINVTMDPTGPTVGILADYVIPTVGANASPTQGITNVGCASIPCSVASGSLYPYYGTGSTPWPRPVSGWGASQCSDEGYAAETIAGLSFGYGLTSTANSNNMGTYSGTVGYSGTTAYNTARTALLASCTSSLFSQAPKWDIVPLGGASFTAQPPPDIYLAQVAAGSADGSSCANAKAISFFNTSANWGTNNGQIGSGTVLHLCGTISTTVANPTSQGTGLITLKFELNAKLAQSAATNLLAITNSTNSWIVTGQAACGWQNHAFVACTEKIQNTANGSPSGFPNTVTGVKVIDVSGTTGSVTIQNLEVGPGYVHNDINDSSFADGAHLANCVWADQLMGNVTIQNSYLHDCSFNVSLNPRQSSPNPVVTLANNEFFHNDHDFVMQSTCNPACYSVVLHDNHSHDHTNWNTLTNQYHHDGFHFFNSQTQASSVLMYNNLFDGPHTANTTGPIFNQVAVQNLTAFNNIFLCTVANCIDDPLSMWQYGGGANQLFVNNTLVQTGVSRTGLINYVQVTAGGSGYTCAPTVAFSYGNATAMSVVTGGSVTAVNMTNQGTGYNVIPTVSFSGCTGTGAAGAASVAFNNNGGVLMNPGTGNTSSNTSFMNNVVDGASTMIDLENQVLAANSATSGLDYNLYSNYQTSGSKAFVWNGSRTDTFATWQGLSGEGTHSSLVASANLDSTGKPQTGSPAIGVGTNLTSLCTGNLVPLCTDYAGVSRPTSGSWTIGAFQVASSNPVVVLNPTSLTFASQLLAVASATQSVTLTNNGPGNVVVSSISITGTNSGDFSQTNTCGTVAQGNTCTITVTFTPTAVGSRVASVSITDNATGSPQSIPLTGTAVVPTLTPASIVFGNGLVGSSVSASQAATLTNPSSVSLSISSITISGAVDAQGFTDFTQVNNCGASLAGGNSCTITVTFTPHLLSALAATLTVAHNAGNSPQTVALTGTGVGNLSGQGAISGSGSIIVKP